MSTDKNEPIYWQSLAERHASNENGTLPGNEFADDLDTKDMDGQTRRHFMGIMGASLAMAGMAGCVRRPVDTILPYSQMPEHVLPGVPLHYATSAYIGGDVVRLIVETNDGRPTKLEGNDYRAVQGGGGSNSTQQATVLDLYDPQRMVTPMKGKLAVTDDAIRSEVARIFKKHRSSKKGLHILSDSNPSPTFYDLQFKAKERLGAQWYTYDALSHDNERNGLKAILASTCAEQPRAVYNFSEARVILSLDADFLGTGARSIANTALWAKNRVPKESQLPSTDDHQIAGLYAVEPVLSLTGSNADHRLRLSHDKIEAFAFQLAAELGVMHGAQSLVPEKTKTLTADEKRFAELVAKDLRSPTPKVNGKEVGVVVAGRRQPPIVHALTAAINYQLNAVLNGAVAYYNDPARELDDAGDYANLNALAKALDAGEVDTLVIIGSNPVYTAPGDLGFAKLMQKAKNIICLSDFPDETVALSQWSIPRAHYLEAWGDHSDIKGMNSLQQPMIEPLHGAWSDIEFLAHLVGEKKSGYELVRAQWKNLLANDKDAKSASGFEKVWRRTLHDGVYGRPVGDGDGINQQGSACPSRGAQEQTITGNVKPLNPADFKTVEKTAATAASLDVIFTQDSTMYDGRFSNNSWLQEVPDPITKLAWDNAALISPQTARELDIPESSQIGKTETSMITLTVNGQTLEMPAWIVPGMADYTVAVAVGYGRDFKGYLPYHENGRVGFDVNPLRTMAGTDVAANATLSKTGQMYAIACLQRFGSQTPGFGYPARALVRETTVENFGFVKSVGPASADPNSKHIWTGDRDFAKSGQIIHCDPAALKEMAEADRPQECVTEYGFVRGGVPKKRVIYDHLGKPRTDIVKEHVVSQPGVTSMTPGVPEGSVQLNPPPRQGATYLSEEDYRKLIEEDPSKVDPVWSPYQWGMNIDLTACTGCNSCVVACVAENNIPSVGKMEARYGREMHWIRMDRYFVGDEENPRVVHQPMTCLQCEAAPCENVCPVQATSHSPEGLNDMTYNRCIGTRYCANNCPVKVRRFNFYNYAGQSSAWDGLKIRNNKIVEPGKDNDLVFMQRNPDVSVRFRGVMEKCTYCTQRITRAKRKARLLKERNATKTQIRAVIDQLNKGTACAQACAAGAITFGDINGPKNSEFNTKRRSHRSYQILTELNLRPRTIYLGKIRYVNKALKDG